MRCALRSSTSISISSPRLCARPPTVSRWMPVRSSKALNSSTSTGRLEQEERVPAHRSRSERVALAVRHETVEVDPFFHHSGSACGASPEAASVRPSLTSA